MGIEFEGLTEFQEDLLVLAQGKIPRESFKIMRKIGNRATTHVRRQARSLVNKKTGTYYKRIKRGRVFKDSQDQTVVRVINSAPHAHLIEYGHNMVTKKGRTVGYVPGKNVMEKGSQSFDASGEFEQMLSKWLDEMLESGNL